MNSLLQHVAKDWSLYDEACLVGDPDERAETALFEMSLLDLIKNHFHPNSTPTINYARWAGAPRPPNCLLSRHGSKRGQGPRRYCSRSTLFGPCQQCEPARVAGAACPRPPETTRGHHQWGASPSWGQPGFEPQSQGLIGKREHNVYHNIAERDPARPRHRVTAPQNIRATVGPPP